jgi:predicted dehydrogenase
VLSGQVRVIAVAEIDAVRRRAAAERHCVRFADHDYRDLLQREDVDLVIVCTPPNTHEKIVIEALEAGKVVICEKPLAHTLASADRILEASRRHPGRLSVVYQLRYLDEVQRMVRLRDEGRLGQLVCGGFHRLSRLPRHQTGGRSWWGRWDVAGGGALITQAIHELDLMCYLFGAPQKVTGMMDTRDLPVESEDCVSATIRFESGAIVSCFCSVAAARHEMRFHVVGGRATVHYPWRFEARDAHQQRKTRKDVLKNLAVRTKSAFASLPMRAFCRARQILTKGQRPPTSGPVNSHEPYWRAILDALEAGQPLPIGPEEARRSLELCAAIYESCLSGQPVSLPLDNAIPSCEGITADEYDRYRSAIGRNECVEA